MVATSAFMSDLVRTIFVMTFSGSLLALLLILIKPLVRHRLPKSVQYYIWLVVLAALLIPISRVIVLPGTMANPIYSVVESNLVSASEARDRNSIPATSMEPGLAPETELTPYEPNITIFSDLVSSTTDTAPSTTDITPTVAEATTSIIPYQPSVVTTFVTIFMLIYPWVVLVVLIYSVISYMYFTKKLRKSNISAQWVELAVLTDLPEGITPRAYINPLVTTPMLIGLFRPVILLPQRQYNFT